jgi:hypothetical protein
MKQNLIVKLGSLAVAALAIGCAQPPNESVEAARGALQKAIAAEAEEYAPAEFQEARDSLASLDAELAAQQGRFAPLRSYTEAGELAARATAAAERAGSAAVAGRQAARDEATLAIESLRASVEAVALLLEQAPAGKDAAADIEALKADLAGIEGSLGELDQSLGQGRFKDAAIKARASLESANAIKAEVTAAIEARKAGRRRS